MVQLGTVITMITYGGSEYNRFRKLQDPIYREEAQEAAILAAEMFRENLMSD